MEHKSNGRDSLKSPLLCQCCDVTNCFLLIAMSEVRQYTRGMSAPVRTRVTSPGSLEALRERNRHRLVSALRSDGALSRAEMARRTGLSRSTVSTVVADLVREGLVQEAGEARTSGTTGGRPATPLTLNPATGAVLAVDLAPDLLTVAAFDLGHRELGIAEHPFDARGESLDACIDQIERGVTDLLAATTLSHETLIGVVIAIPAPVEETSRRVGHESVIGGIVGTALEARVHERLGLPVRLENDANLSALAERAWGAAAGHRDAVYVELSHGIGAGLIIDGRLHRGPNGTAGEIGHIPIAADGEMCRCGNRGCLELLAGTDAITQLVAGRFESRPDIQRVIARADAGDPMCRRALRDAGSRIGVVLGQICNVLNPTIIVIGGELARGWSILEPSLREAIDRSAIQPAIRDLVLSPSALGPRGRLLGGLALILDDPIRFPLRPRQAL